MKLSTLLLATCFLGTAFGQQVQVANPGFADDEIFCNGCFYPAITGWVVGPNSGVQKATPADFPGGIPGGSPNYAYVGNANSTGSISQVVTTVKANRTYTLTMSIGQRGTFTGYIAALIANGVVLASDSSLRPSPNTFSEETIVYNSGPNPAQNGSPLVIFVKSRGNGQIDLANVSLTVQ